MNKLGIFIILFIIPCDSLKCSWNYENLISFEQNFYSNQSKNINEITCLNSGEWGISRSPCDIDKNSLAGFTHIYVYDCEFIEDKPICRITDLNRKKHYSTRLATRFLINCECGEKNNIKKCTFHINAKFKPGEKDYHPVITYLLLLTLFLFIFSMTSIFYYYPSLSTIVILMVYVIYLEKNKLDRYVFNSYVLLN